MFSSGSGASPDAADAVTDLPSALRDVAEKSCKEQAEWWTEVARGLRPGPRLKEFPPDRVLNDVLGHYFSATSEGIGRVFDHHASSAGTVPVDRLHHILQKHFGFFDGGDPEAADEDNQHLKWLRDAFGTTIGRFPFEYTIRHLRLGVLLAQGIPEAEVYVYSYDGSSLEGSYVPCAETRREKRENTWYTVPEVAKQAAIGQEGCSVDSIGAFLLDGDQGKNHQVHWVHAHEPPVEFVLALGQRFQIPTHIQESVSQLHRARPQLESLPGASWSSLVLPFLYLDNASKKSLRAYHRWLFTHDQKSRSSLPPRIQVSAARLNVAMLWSNSARNTLVSVACQPELLSRWITDDAPAKEPDRTSIWQRWFGRRKGHEYKALSQDENAANDLESPSGLFQEDHELDMELEMRFEKGSMLQGQVEDNLFEKNFEAILQQMGDGTSLLRMGSCTQLLGRMILNTTNDYLNIIEVYAAAIDRITRLLQDRHVSKKDDLIAKISAAKLQLGALLRLLEPVAEQIKPEIEKHLGDNATTRRHVFDICNNIQNCVPSCKAQIENCEALIGAYERAAADKTANILNILTVVTFLITPMQVLTGLYGMNFVHMPELQWHYGYHYFFALSVFLTVACAIALIVSYRQLT
eukprot:TRINITY_DN32941_c0_g1_i1.p1 TRINITY_DN32941_c0_g1~~TRINITY_DN32941_c0_g1_i1.p1  ORF type:complete len:636 (-),score=104.34 TRINITY_DN32941_c0_g1_i1:40-1947(-)